MESTDLDMDEIFDDNDIDEDVGATGVLPDLPEASQTQNEDEENAEVLERLKNLSKGAAKKVVRKPQPKLDPTRLTGERGIPILPKLFKDVKFKGKGHEAQDLATLMRQMEHWGHRLFPKMPFDEVIERVEKLGSKKEVQTCIKKIRLDMPILDNDFVGSDQEDDDVIRRGEEEVKRGEVKADDMWDELLREEAELTGSQMGSDSSEVVGTSNEVQPSSPPMVDTEPVLGTPSSRLQKEAVTPGGITPEQLERIERNKQLALERRLKKMGQLTPGSKALSSPLSSRSTGKPVGSQSESEAENATKKGSDVDDNADSQIQKSVNESNSRTSVAGDEDEKEATVKGMETENSENVEEMDTEMSEVLEKGPSQNITVTIIPQENAQNWHTGPDSGEDSGLKFGSGSVEGSDKICVDNGTVADKNRHSEEISEVTNKQDFPKCDSTSDSADSQQMSEIIERQDVSKVILKEKPDSLNSKDTGEEEKLGVEDSKLSEITLDSFNENKENTCIQKHDGRVEKEISVCVKERPAQVVDKICSDSNMEDFDDELTEDQLMDTLEN